MKIQNSMISMSGKSSSFQTQSKTEHLRSWGAGKELNVDTRTKEVKSQLHMKDIMELTQQVQKDLDALTQRITSTETTNGIDIKAPEQLENEENSLITDKDRAKLLLVKSMLESIFGKKTKFYVLDSKKLSPEEMKSIKISPMNQPSIQLQKPQGWGFDYNFSETKYESQKMSFSSSGVVKTQDGREIDFSVALNMSREVYESTNISIKEGDAKLDPLVINFDGPTASLTDKNFSFDLDADGHNENIAFTGVGSGFLAFDKNGDGKINDGSELFGVKSGNGFADLAEYDQDKNGWIDENDEIFSKLRIWTKEPDGSDKLFAIGVKGVGAIYLGNAQTSFDLKNTQNETSGTIRRTGIFLKENGSAGTIQHVDLAL